MADLEHDVPNTLETKFRIASITKPFTAAAILILQQRGKLRVQDSICQYLPECPVVWKLVSIHHLLSQTSGVPDFTDLPDNWRYQRLPMAVPELIGLVKDKPLDFTPGDRFAYSNSNYLLLGYLIERISGEKYEDFLQKNIYQPLGMLDSGYDHPWLSLKHRAQGYALKDGSPVNANWMAMDAQFAFGSAFSTVGDLLLWDQALYTQELLSQESLKLMFTPNPQTFPPGWLLGSRGGYGSGWSVEENYFGRKVCLHPGVIDGFSSIIMRYPEDKTLVVVLDNREEQFDGDVHHLRMITVAQGLSAIAFGLPPDSSPVSGTNSEPALKK